MAVDKLQNIPKMTFDQVKGQLQGGELFFTSGEYFVSKIIQKITKSNISHVAFISKWFNEVMLFESVESEGVRVVQLNRKYLLDYAKGKKYKGGLYVARIKDTAIDVEKLTKKR